KAAALAAKHAAKETKTAAPKMVVPKTAEEPLAKTPARATPPPPPKEEPKPEPVIIMPKPAAKPKPAPVEAEPADTAGKIHLNIVKPEETKKARVTIPQSADKNYIFPDIKLL